jgi:hypothetical protein
MNFHCFPTRAACSGVLPQTYGVFASSRYCHDFIVPAGHVAFFFVIKVAPQCDDRAVLSQTNGVAFRIQVALTSRDSHDITPAGHTASAIIMIPHCDDRAVFSQTNSVV